MRTTIVLESSTFRNNEPIPRRFTCDGENLSPPLKWSGAPPTVRSYALICDDPNAPIKTWVHWVVYCIPSSRSELPEGLPARKEFPDGMRQGRNSWMKTGYGGPCPPRGKLHRYVFRIYVLGAEPSLLPGASKKSLLKAMEGHVLDEVDLVGTYSRV